MQIDSRWPTFLLSVIFLGVIALIWVWDSVFQIRGEPAHTVSSMVFSWCKAWPIIPFGLGVVIGHILW